MPLARKTDIHIVGDANENFFSQIAFFCRALRRLYDRSGFLRVRCFLGGATVDWEKVPPHIAECRQEVEIIYADPIEYATRGMYVQCDQAFLDIKSDAELIVFADADTFWFQRPDALLETVFLNRGVAGCMAHYPPPDAKGNSRAYWKTLFEEHVGWAPSFDHTCSLAPDIASPFYINFAFVAVDADMMRRYGALYIHIARQLQQQSSHPHFSYQIALTLWTAKLNMKTISIPFHYNFPNDDKVYEFTNLDERDIIVFHYLREHCFKRGEIFVNAEGFRRFLSADKGRADMLLASLWQGEFNVAEWIQPSRASAVMRIL